jgi:excisionase family DNA binding protein
MPPTLFTIPETADQLRVSRHTVYGLIEAGKLRAVLLGAGGTLRVRSDDLTAYIDSLPTTQESK